VNDADAIGLANQYRVSSYDRDFDPANKTSGRDVQRVKGAELVRAMEENVEQARAMRDEVKTRWERAEHGGLFDDAALEATTDGAARKAWLYAQQSMRGDRIRCVAELRHWREYLGWAMRKAAREMPSREVGADDDDPT
jgi:hypothetical protein